MRLHSPEPVESESTPPPLDPATPKMHGGKRQIAPEATTPNARKLARLDVDVENLFDHDEEDQFDEPPAKPRAQHLQPYPIAF